MNTHKKDRPEWELQPVKINHQDGSDRHNDFIMRLLVDALQEVPMFGFFLVLCFALAIAGVWLLAMPKGKRP